MSESETAADGLTAEQPQTMEEYFEQKEREGRREARQEQAKQDSGPELIGMPRFGPDETKTCDRCGETTLASEWKPCGPTYRENGRRVKMVTMLGCPNCPHMD